MNPVPLLLLYFAGATVGGALLAPPLYWCVQALIDAGMLEQLTHYRFPKYLNRAVLLVALIGLWPLFRGLRVGSARSLGLDPNPHRWRDFAVGLAISLAGLAALACVSLAIGRVDVRDDVPLRIFASALATGLTVGVLEEVLFRGVFLGALRRHYRLWLAVLMVTVFYAVVHFIEPHPSVRSFDAGVTWMTGLSLVPYSFWKLAVPEIVLGRFFTLLAIGLILAWTVIERRSLAMAIGLHAGWVSGLKAFLRSTEQVAPPDWWFGPDLTTGLAPLVLMLATAGVMWVVLGRWRTESWRQAQPADTMP